MKIAFWSTLRGRCGVTTNLACMAAITAISGTGRSILLENHYHLNNLGSRFLPPEKLSVLQEKGEYYNKYGMEYLLKRLYTGESGEVLIHKSSIPLFYSDIFYLPQSYIVNKEVFNYEFELVRGKLFDCLERFSDLVMIDTETNGNVSSVSILQEVDLIVVNMDQDLATWNRFFQDYPSLAEKSVFLIGKYQPELHWNLTKLRRRFQVPRSRIGAVPYNMELKSAMENGRLIQFLNRNYPKRIHPENESLMRELSRSSRMLLDQIKELQKSQK